MHGIRSTRRNGAGRGLPQTPWAGAGMQKQPWIRARWVEFVKDTGYTFPDLRDPAVQRMLINAELPSNEGAAKALVPVFRECAGITNTDIKNALNFNSGHLKGDQCPEFNSAIFRQRQKELAARRARGAAAQEPAAPETEDEAAGEYPEEPSETEEPTETGGDDESPNSPGLGAFISEDESIPGVDENIPPLKNEPVVGASSNQNKRPSSNADDHQTKKHCSQSTFSAAFEAPELVPKAEASQGRSEPMRAARSFRGGAAGARSISTDESEMMKDRIDANPSGRAAAAAASVMLVIKLEDELEEAVAAKDAAVAAKKAAVQEKCKAVREKNKAVREKNDMAKQLAAIKKELADTKRSKVFLKQRFDRLKESSRAMVEKVNAHEAQKKKVATRQARLETAESELQDTAKDVSEAKDNLQEVMERGGA